MVLLRVNINDAGFVRKDLDSRICMFKNLFPAIVLKISKDLLDS